MTKEELEQLKSTVKQWLFHTGSLDPTNYANELKLKFIEPKEKRIEELETQIEKMKSLEGEIINVLKESEDCAWLHAHNGKAKYLYLQSAIDVVRDKFEEIKEK